MLDVYILFCIQQLFIIIVNGQSLSFVGISDDVIAASQTRTQSNPFSNNSDKYNNYYSNMKQQQQFGQPNSAFAQVSSLNNYRQNNEQQRQPIGVQNSASTTSQKPFAKHDDHSNSFNVFNKQNENDYFQTQLNDFSSRYLSTFNNDSFKYSNRKKNESVAIDQKESHYDDDDAINGINRQERQVGRSL